MRIAVVGARVSGLVVAHRAGAEHAAPVALDDRQAQWAVKARSVRNRAAVAAAG